MVKWLQTLIAIIIHEKKNNVVYVYTCARSYISVLNSKRNHEYQRRRRRRRKVFQGRFHRPVAIANFYFLLITSNITVKRNYILQIMLGFRCCIHHDVYRYFPFTMAMCRYRYRWIEKICVAEKISKETQVKNTLIIYAYRL